jgi:hypothetical protein
MAVSGMVSTLSKTETNKAKLSSELRSKLGGLEKTAYRRKVPDALR